ncbi:MAG: serine/threonine-protein kinase [Myxococcota bacterium]
MTGHSDDPSGLSDDSSARAPRQPSTPAAGPVDPPLKADAKWRFGPYEVASELGRGGMCHVYRARHDNHEYDVALKLLREDRRKDEQMVEMFITEADLAMLLDHPNLIRTYDAGEIDNNHYIAMELVEGGSLERLLRRGREIAAPLPLDFALFVVSEVLEGLHALHTAAGHTGRPLGLIHRDVTPQNIFLSFDGRVILGDFGVALIRAYGASDPRLVMGKLGYLAPEMVLMENVDHRADLFAASIVLWELLTGQRLFHGGGETAVLERIADAKVARPSKHRTNLPTGLDDVLLKGLARRPKDRFESAEAMLYALEPFWSRTLAGPQGLAAYLSASFPSEYDAYRQQQKV